MRAVTGSIELRKSVSIRRAATIITNFVAKEKCARREVDAYLKRAAIAITDLRLFHRQLRDELKISQMKEKKRSREIKVENGEVEDGSEKRKKIKIDRE